MSENHLITAYSVIRNGQFIRNGKSIPVEEGETLGKTLKALYRHDEIAYPKFFKMDAMSKLAFLAAEWLEMESGFASQYRDEEIGVVMANASSSLQTDRKYQKTLGDFPSPGLFVYTLPNIAAGEICIRHKIQGENAFFISESFDPEFLYDYVEGLFLRKKIQACIAGWVECEEGRYDTFLYFIEKKQNSNSQTGLPHTPKQLETLYSS
ncbi:hypothetical protein N9933_00265 [bacterium]|nr:hypothetical protein [bacterium]